MVCANIFEETIIDNFVITLLTVVFILQLGPRFLSTFVRFVNQILYQKFSVFLHLLIMFCRTDKLSLLYFQGGKQGGVVVRELPPVGVDENGDLQVITDSVGDIHIYAKPNDNVLVHQQKSDTSKV